MEIKEYVVAKSAKEAYDLFMKSNNNSLIGGGAWMKMASHKKIDTLIDLKNLPLNTIENNKDAFLIGANVTLRELEVYEAFQDFYDGIIVKAIKQIMGMGIRNIATIGGSIMGRFSFSDLFAILIALDVKLDFYNHKHISLREFLENKKFEKDVLLHVIIPKKQGRGYFVKAKRISLDFAILNLCIIKNPSFEIVVGARPGIATRAVKASEYLDNNKITDETIHKAIDIVLDEIRFSSNIRASKEYREDLVKVYISRGIKEVIS